MEIFNTLLTPEYCPPLFIPEELNNRLSSAKFQENYLLLFQVYSLV